MTELASAHARFGWISLFFWMLFGYTLEMLHGFKAPAYLQDELRRELWTLAHLHGAVLSLLNLIWAGRADTPRPAEGRGPLASRALRTGSVLLPLGFLLGGWVHHEGDPGAGIFLSPLGAALVLAAVGMRAFRGRP